MHTMTAAASPEAPAAPACLWLYSPGGIARFYTLAGTAQHAQMQLLLQQGEPYKDRALDPVCKGALKRRWLECAPRYRGPRSGWQGRVLASARALTQQGQAAQQCTACQVDHATTMFQSLGFEPEAMAERATQVQGAAQQLAGGLVSVCHGLQPQGAVATAQRSMPEALNTWTQSLQ